MNRDHGGIKGQLCAFGAVDQSETTWMRTACVSCANRQCSTELVSQTQPWAGGCPQSYSAVLPAHLTLLAWQLLLPWYGWPSLHQPDAPAASPTGQGSCGGCQHLQAQCDGTEQLSAVVQGHNPEGSALLTECLQGRGSSGCQHLQEHPGGLTRRVLVSMWQVLDHRGSAVGQVGQAHKCVACPHVHMCMCAQECAWWPESLAGTLGCISM